MITVIPMSLPSCRQMQKAMEEPVVRIGDQIILEENYDDTYVPSEQGNGSCPSRSWDSCMQVTSSVLRR